MKNEEKERLKALIGRRVKDGMYGEGTVVGFASKKYTCNILVAFDSTHRGLHDGDTVSLVAGATSDKMNRYYYFSEQGLTFIDTPKKLEFVKGKWYFDTVSNLYIKFQEWKPTLKDYFYSSERIFEGKFEKIANDGWGFIQRSWREADLSEIQQYLPEGHADKKVVNKDRVVHCTTQEEWDFVTRALLYSWGDHSKWNTYSERTCIQLSSNSFGTNDFYNKNNYQILSFKEWCEEFGHSFEAIGNELTALPENWCVCPRTEENLAIIKKWCPQYNTYQLTSEDNAYTCDKKYRPHLHHALNGGYTEITFDQFKKWVLKEGESTESLLEQAKRMYPIGTEVVCLRGGRTGIIDSHNNNSLSVGQIAFSIGRSANAYIYIPTRWAEIVSLPTATPAKSIYMQDMKDGLLDLVGYELHDLQGNSIGIIDKHYDVGLVYVKGQDYNVHYMTSPYLMKGRHNYNVVAKKPESSKPVKQPHQWKVGDKFQVTEDNANGSNTKVGVVYTVKEVRNIFVTIQETCAAVGFENMIPVQKEIPESDSWLDMQQKACIDHYKEQFRPRHQYLHGKYGVQAGGMFIQDPTDPRNQTFITANLEVVSSKPIHLNKEPKLYKKKKRKIFSTFVAPMKGVSQELTKKNK